MKTFRFSLQRVLEWRTLQLKASEEKLTQLMQQMSSLVRQDEQLLEEYRKNAAHLVSSQVLDGAELHRLAAYQVHANNSRYALQKHKTQCASLILDQRQQLLKARKEHRVLEKLKETRLKNWIYLNEREIESTAAEAYLSQWARWETTEKNEHG